MSRAVASPPVSINAHNAEGDTFIGHSPEVARGYREAAAKAALHGPGKVTGQVPAQAPAESPRLPMSGVANAVVGQHLRQMREQAAQLEKSILSPPIGPGGYQVDHLVNSQRQARIDLDLLREEIMRIETMDDVQVRELAFKLGRQMIAFTAACVAAIMLSLAAAAYLAGYHGVGYYPGSGPAAVAAGNQAEREHEHG